MPNHNEQGLLGTIFRERDRRELEGNAPRRTDRLQKEKISLAVLTLFHYKNMFKSEKMFEICSTRHNACLQRRNMDSRTCLNLEHAAESTILASRSTSDVTAASHTTAIKYSNR
ncbi:hypothetical protein AVEN_90827-1 [Araneus ventricosus]|uniref:Uncharacterized protein n=1 Tax=Araneus ventricosus TaxID=182803 RepID=A0A4Y2QDF4_ARAVE|nr:hypothetical protein AVEN_90827-1 [Araneus ventricosus]